MHVTDYDLLPYGAFLSRNSVTWYDRHYRPIAAAPWFIYDVDTRTIFAGELTPVEPTTRIDFERQGWIYNDGNSPTFDRKTRARLREMVASLPRMKAELIRRQAVQA